MFNNSSKVLFFLILMMGTTIAVSANSWLGAWMGLEINLLAFIPLMSDTNNLMSSEASLKYFLTQALASSMLLFSILLMILENKIIINFNNIIFSLMMISTLLLKSGSAPFHFWFPNVMEGLSWSNALILMTWQKIAPFMLISYMPIKSIFLICAILSSLIGALGGLNQTSLRKLMAYSSINHLGWMLASMQASENLWQIYFFMYTFLSVNLIMLFNIFKIFHFNQLFLMFLNSKSMKFTLFFNLFSLGGLPPFLGFFPKWMVIQMLIENDQMFLLIILVSMTLITLYFYLRMCYSAFMLNYFEIQWINYTNLNLIYFKFSMILSFMSNFGLIFISLVYFIY
uniref:NADH-ubiquinone oxidoreductase chain 2 n=1 Tax=Pseudogriphoneura sp. ACMJ-2016 TaxID=1783256 RepID=A0A140CP93_9MUSC|nr:NADH dehydrogenase subunit 2 [Pseudogriphoneura sp. ACMJ-2016]